MTRSRKPVVPSAILCDLDGTLALFDREKENPYDRDFSQDTVNKAVLNLLWGCNDWAFVFILSGRREKHRAVTERWLKKNDIDFEALYMRGDGDNRKDSIVKGEMYIKHVKEKYDVIAVFDDRLQVCRLWYKLGLPLFRVGDPDANY